jgi:hypothetical protein
MLLRVVTKKSVFCVHRNFSVCHRHQYTSFLLQKKAIEVKSQFKNNHTIIVNSIVQKNVIRGRIETQNPESKQKLKCKNLLRA